MILAAIQDVSQRRHQLNGAVESPTSSTAATPAPGIATAASSRNPSRSSTPAEQTIIMTSIEEGTMPWSSLGSDLQSNPDFAQGLTLFPNMPAAQDFFQRFPALARDLRFWERLLNREKEEQLGAIPNRSLFLLYDLLDRFASEEFINDHRLMIQACLLNWRVLDLVASRSSMGESFWVDLLRRDPLLLRHIPRSAQLRFPNAVAQTLQALGEHPDLTWDVAALVAERIAPALWRKSSNNNNNHHCHPQQRNDVLLRWFQAGLPFVGSVFGPNLLRLQNEGQIFLLVAKHCARASFRYRSFGFSGASLCADKEFMLQVVEMDAALFAYASRELQQNDFDLALLFLSSDLDTIEKYFAASASHYSIEEQKQYKHTMHTFVQQRLHFYNAFVSTILCGFVDSGSTFSMLNQGTETATMYKQSLVHSLHVPCGSELLRLRRALANMTKLVDKA